MGVIDVNRLGQRGETMYGRNRSLCKKDRGFWLGNNRNRRAFLSDILDAYEKAGRSEKPVMIIAKTVKGKGVSFLEDKNGWHGVALKREDSSGR